MALGTDPASLALVSSILPRPWWGATDGEGPLFMANPWDTCFFAGKQMPGKWTVTGLPTLAVDEKKHAGVDGAVITTQGIVPGPIEVEGLIFTKAQWLEFEEKFAPKIWRKPHKTATLGDLAVSIAHPALSTWGIGMVVVVGVSALIDGPIRQSKIVRIKCLEYIAPDGKTATKTAKPASASPALGPNSQPAKNSPLNKPPSETDTGVHGAAPATSGGAE